MPRVKLEIGDRFGRCTVTEVNVKPFISELKCDCGRVYQKKNSKLKGTKSCGKCPRIWILGEVFGKWTVTGWSEDNVKPSSGDSSWNVTCECGTQSERSSRDLRTGNSTHCGCSPVYKKPKDISGKKLNRLLATTPTGLKSSNGDYIWNFLCDCGVEVQASIGNFNSGQKKSCGCLVGDTVRARDNYHGMQNTNTYNSWRKMRERCNNPNDILYPKYGGVGVTVCKDWEDSFQKFHEDMGDAPDGFTIDRIDTHGNYEPSNCRWGSRYVQSRNRGSYVGSSRYKGVQWEESSGK